MQHAYSSHILDNPVYASLCSAEHAGLVRSRGRVLRYLEDVSPVMGLPEDTTEGDWGDAACLLKSGTAAFVHRSGLIPPIGNPVDQFQVLQMTASGAEDGIPNPDPRVIHLEATDVPEMLALAQRTGPGPFFARTIEMGNYLGIRHNGALIAMAGERMNIPGWVEISAVCTSPEHRGKGLGSGLMRILAGHIAARGSRAFLHVVPTNGGAIQLYKSLGFVVRRDFTVTVLRRPDPLAPGAS